MALKRPLGGHLGISGVIFGQNSGEGCYWHLLSRDQHEHVLSRFSHVRLFATPWTVARQAPLPMGFSRQEYRNGFPYPPAADLPDPGIEPLSPVSPALRADSLLLGPQGSAGVLVNACQCRGRPAPKISPAQFLSGVEAEKLRQRLLSRKWQGQRWMGKAERVSWGHSNGLVLKSMLCVIPQFSGSASLTRSSWGSSTLTIAS